jgi:hypothetical protein
MGCRRWIAVVCLLCAMGSVCAHASATLLLEEPYSYEGPSRHRHVAVYLDRVCADSPLPCAAAKPANRASLSAGIMESRTRLVCHPANAVLYAVSCRSRFRCCRSKAGFVFARSVPAQAFFASSPTCLTEVPKACAARRIVLRCFSYAFQVETTRKDDELIGASMPIRTWDL